LEFAARLPVDGRDADDLDPEADFAGPIRSGALSGGSATNSEWISTSRNS